MSDEEIGEVVRQARKAHGLTLQQLSERCGLSESFLSQFERGKSKASIASLRLLTASLGMTLSDIFDINGAAAARVLRADRRPVVPFGEKAIKYLITARMVPRFEMFLLELEEGGSTGADQYAHGESDELVLVQQGTIRLDIGDEIYQLGPGDATSFRSDTPHRAANAGSAPAQVLWIVSPPAAH